nr:hypothetical protein [Agrilactobacillus composti]
MRLQAVFDGDASAKASAKAETDTKPVADDHTQPALVAVAKSQPLTMTQVIEQAIDPMIGMGDTTPYTFMKQED